MKLTAELSETTEISDYNKKILCDLCGEKKLFMGLPTKGASR
jgi:hypothetical protein